MPVKFLLTFFFAACAVHPAQAQTYSSSQMMFRGYACIDDCSDHEDGYAWAAEHSVALGDDCAGTATNSFIEGCLAWVTEQQAGTDAAIPAIIEPVEAPENDYYE
ncbi:MAG: hypothetical protein ACXW4B_09240 [Micavibrio sp.]